MEYFAGLAKRGVMIGALRWELTRCRRYGRVMSALLLSLDLQADSSALVASRKANQIGRLVRSSIREVDLIGHYGGTELLVLLPETPKDGAAAAAERVRSVVEKRGLLSPAGRDESQLTVSIGVAGYPEDGSSVADLLGAAENALREASAEGGNRVQVAGNPRNERGISSKIRYLGAGLAGKG